MEVLFDAATARECTFKTFDSYSFAPDGSKLLIATETTPIYRHSYTAVHYIYSLKRNLDGKINNIIGKSFRTAAAAGARIFTGRQPGGFCTRQQHLPCKTALQQQRKPGDGRRETERGAERHPRLGLRRGVLLQPCAGIQCRQPDAGFHPLRRERCSLLLFPSFFAGQAPTSPLSRSIRESILTNILKRGEVNSKVSVHTFDIKSKVTRKINVPVDADGYIPCIRFTQDPNKLAVATLNRHQNRFDLYFADPRSTVAKLALRDESDTYIRENVFDNIVFYPENFSFVSEKSGYNHLYWYSIGGNLLKQVTAGQYEVQEFWVMTPKKEALLQQQRGKPHAQCHLQD